jgi:ABC-2 type transport system permease protein
MRQALAVARKEMRQIVRDRRTLLILLAFPAFVLLLFGYALNFDIRHVKLAVEDRDRTLESRSLVSAFVNSGYFDLAATVEDDRAAIDLMDRNHARAALVVPIGFGGDLRAGRRTTVQVLIDGDNANTAATVMGYAGTIVGTESQRYLPQAGASRPLLTIEPRVWYNPELRSTLFLVPGLLAYIAMIVAVVSTALAVVREKERGTVEQVRMAPIGTLPFVMGKTVPYLGISVLSSLGVLFASMVLFDLPVRGSWVLLIVALMLFLTGALGLGLLISTVADTQQVAFQAAVLASLLPTMLLSGFIFPIASMPKALQLVTYLVPARYFLVALRGIVLKGVGLDVVGGSLLALAAFAAGVLLLAAIRLRREWA